MKKFMLAILIILASSFILACSPVAEDDTQELLRGDYDDEVLDFGDFSDQPYQEDDVQSELGLEDFDDDLIEFGQLI